MSAESATGEPGLVFGPGPDGWWDSERLSSPQVVLDAGIWKLWYYGRDPTFDRMVNLPTGRCGLATSPDGIRWERTRGPLTMGSVFEPSSDPYRFDNAHVGVSDIHKENDRYRIWYFGGDQTTIEMKVTDRIRQAKGIRMQPGCAISGDGITWSRLEGPYRGAFLEPGQPGEFDSLFCAWPRVVKADDGSYLMYYHTLDLASGFTVGLASSPDGLDWEKRGPILGPGAAGSFDERGISCRHVIRHDGRYLMFYQGANYSGYYCIGLAISDDGIHWSKDAESAAPGGPIFCHAPKGSGRWDARAVGTPCVVKLGDGSFRLYYVGANEGGHDELSSRHQIGLALSDGADYRCWRRWGE